MNHGLELSRDLDNRGTIRLSFLEQLHESGSGQGPAGKRQGDLCPLGKTQMSPCLFVAIFVHNPQNLWTLGLRPRCGET